MVKRGPNKLERQCEELGIPLEDLVLRRALVDPENQYSGKAWFFNNEPYRNPELAAEAYFRSLGYFTTWNDWQSGVGCPDLTLWSKQALEAGGCLDEKDYLRYVEVKTTDSLSSSQEWEIKKILSKGIKVSVLRLVMDEESKKAIPKRPPKLPLQIFKSRLKKYRKGHDIPRARIVELLSIKSWEYYSIEEGSKDLDFNTIVCIADFLQVSLDYLAGRIDDIESSYLSKIRRRRGEDMTFKIQRRKVDKKSVGAIKNAMAAIQEFSRLASCGDLTSEETIAFRSWLQSFPPINRKT